MRRESDEETKRCGVSPREQLSTLLRESHVEHSGRLEQGSQIIEGIRAPDLTSPHIPSFVQVRFYCMMLE